VKLQRIDGVGRARGQIAARRWPSGEEPPVAVNGQQQAPGRPRQLLRRGRVHGAPPAAMLCRESRLVTSATADVSSDHVHASAGATTRTKTSPDGIAAAYAAKASRSRRRTVLRCTALPTDVGMAYATQTPASPEPLECGDQVTRSGPERARTLDRASERKRPGPCTRPSRRGCAGGAEVGSLRAPDKVRLLRRTGVGSGRQLGATLGPTGLEDRPAAGGGHTSTEPVLLGTATVVWLECALHDENLPVAAPEAANEPFQDRGYGTPSRTHEPGSAKTGPSTGRKTRWRSAGAGAPDPCDC
jgi:hypothetical protein